MSNKEELKKGMLVFVIDNKYLITRIENNNVYGRKIEICGLENEQLIEEFTITKIYTKKLFTERDFDVMQVHMKSNKDQYGFAKGYGLLTNFQENKNLMGNTLNYSYEIETFRYRLNRLVADGMFYEILVKRIH